MKRGLHQKGAPASREFGRHFVVGTVWLGLSAFLAYAGYFAAYAFFAYYDDEGYWILSLRTYHLHGSLYHDTFGSAGPLFYELWSLAYSVSGLSVNWDTGRLMTLIAWIATSLVMGMAVWIMSRRLLLGLLAEVVSFLVMFLLCGVAMEPAGLAHLFAATVVLGLALFTRGRRQTGIGIVGVASTAIFFTKINVGVFVIAGLVAAVAIYWPGPRWVTARRVAAGLGVLAIPVLLMEQVLTESSAWHYCVLEMIYLGGLIAILFTGRRPTHTLAYREVGLVVSAAIVSTVLIALGVLVNGTTLPQLIHGAIFSQYGLARIGLIPLPITGAEVGLAIISSLVAFAIALGTMRRGQRPSWLSSVFSGYVRLAVGAWILLTICEAVFPGWNPQGLVIAPTVTLPVPGQSFLLAAPFVWIAALGGGDEAGGYGFTRVSICLMGTMGCLEGYPVAGSQWSWAALSLVPVGILCIADGLTMTTSDDKRTPLSIGLGVGVPLGSLVSVVMLVLLTLGNVGESLSQWKATYYQNVPVKLLGAQHVRLSVFLAEDLQIITSFLKQNCQTYWSIPGLNSFYLLSGKESPSGLNSTQAWWFAFTVPQQDGILDRLRRIPRLCVVEDASYSHGKYGNDVLPRTRLVRYLQEEFVVVKTVANNFYQLLVRRSATTSR